MAAVGQLAHRVSRVGKDDTKLGRWVWIEFSGRDGFATRVYTAYRPGNVKPSQSKNTTVYDQHTLYIRNNGYKCTPRELFDRDLRQELSFQIQTKQ